MQGNSSKVSSTRRRLLRLVESREIGSLLPPERELALELNVARMTLRRAMDDLNQTLQQLGQAVYSGVGSAPGGAPPNGGPGGAPSGTVEGEFREV